MSRRRAAALSLAPLVWFLAAGCGPRGGAAGNQPSWRRPPQLATSSAALREIRFEPDSAAMGAYNDPPHRSPPRSELADGVIAAVEEASAALEQEPPRADGRLYDAAQELAEVAPEDAPLPYRLVEFTMQRHGIIEPSPHLVVVWGPTHDPSTILAKLEERLPDILSAADFARLGVGSVHRPEVGEAVTVLAFQSSFVETEAIPRTVESSGSFRLDGRVKEPFREPKVFVTREDGTVVRTKMIRIGERGFRASVHCANRRGRQQIEITAADESGSTVMANFPVWCGEEPPRSLTVNIPGAGEPDFSTAEEAEDQLAELVNRDRIEHGLPPLEIDAGVREVAQDHSREMFETGVVAHISPNTGSAVDRVERRGIKSSVVLENVARAYGVAEAEEGLMNSPGHRANILSAQATHMGIGITLGEEVAGRRELFITQLFIRSPGELDPTPARKQLESIMQRTRTLAADRDLDEVAASFARLVAAGVPTEEASRRSAARLRRMRTRYSRVTTVVTAVADLNAFDPSKTLRDKRITSYGLGLAQGDHQEMGADAIYIVLLLGHQ